MKSRRKEIRKRIQRAYRAAEWAQAQLRRGNLAIGGQVEVNGLWDEYRGLCEAARRMS